MSKQLDARAEVDQIKSSVVSYPLCAELGWQIYNKSTGDGYDGEEGVGWGDGEGGEHDGLDDPDDIDDDDDDNGGSIKKLCEYNDCKRRAVERCDVCKRDFCREHIDRKKHKC